MKLILSKYAFGEFWLSYITHTIVLSIEPRFLNAFDYTFSIILV